VLRCHRSDLGRVSTNAEYESPSDGVFTTCETIERFFCHHRDQVPCHWARATDGDRPAKDKFPAIRVANTWRTTFIPDRTARLAANSFESRKAASHKSSFNIRFTRFRFSLSIAKEHSGKERRTPFAVMSSPASADSTAIAGVVCWASSCKISRNREHSCAECWPLLAAGAAKAERETDGILK